MAVLVNKVVDVFHNRLVHLIAEQLIAHGDIQRTVTYSRLRHRPELLYSPSDNHVTPWFFLVFSSNVTFQGLAALHKSVISGPVDGIYYDSKRRS